MRTQFIIAVLGALFVASPVLAQTPAAGANKPDTSCNTTSSAAAPGNTQTADTSMAVEKSAILPSAGGHANSAAPTVQSDGKAMQPSQDCPPETKK